MIYISVDGSCNSKNGEGSWSYVIGKRSFSGREWDTTNNRMELIAAIKALNHFSDPQDIIIFSDSAYVVNGMNYFSKKWRENGWKTHKNEDVKNRDVWEELLLAREKHNSVYFKWVPREQNGRADAAARKARKNFERKK